MKKGLFSFFVMLTFLVACTNNNDSVIASDPVEVIFNVETETLSTSRTISDGSGATQLMYAVFDTTGEVIVSKQVVDNATKLLTAEGYTLRMTLARGQSYKVVFWAQNPECDSYLISDDMQLTINYEGINNDEERDAFYAITEAFTMKGNQTINVTLKRPFAQVNLGAFPFDYEHVKELGLEISTSSAIIQNVANKFNMFTGEVEGDVEVKYSLSTIPNEPFMVDMNEDGIKETYTYLSMSYILASSETSTHKMAFILAEADGGSPAEFADGLDFVPILRNHRTNIVGQILSGDIAFNIKVDPTYDGDIMHSGGLYYNFSEDVFLKDKQFTFNTNDAATFTSENNTLISLEDVEFAGNVQFIAFGEYRDKGNYVDFTNEFKNVIAKDMVVTHSVGIENVQTIDYMAPLIFLRGNNTLTDCIFTGTTSVAPDKKDYNGDYHEVIAYDCGVPNQCIAEFVNCTVDKLYAWSHAQITLKNSKVKYLRCSTHNNSKPAAHLTIDSGSHVEEIVVSSTGTAGFKTVDGKRVMYATPWAPCIIIKAGAKVDRLDMNFRPSINNSGNLTVIIESGAIVGEVVNAIDEIPNAPLVTE